MRILLIVHGFPPLAFGGTEIYTHDLALELRGLGHRVVVITREANPDAPEYRLRHESYRGLDVYSVNNTFRHSRSYEDAYRNPAIDSVVGKLLEELCPDVAHVQHLTCLSTGLIGELERRNIPTYFTLNDYWLICQRGQLLDLDLTRCAGPDGGCHRCADAALGLAQGLRKAGPLFKRAERALPSPVARQVRALAARAPKHRGQTADATDEQLHRMDHVLDMASKVDLFLAPSKTLCQRFVDFGIAPDRIQYMEQGIDLRSFDDLVSTPSERLRIGFLGSLMVSKAPHLLLEAFAALPEGAASLELLGTHAAYHGDDSYRRSLEPRLEASKASFRGPLPHDEIPSALASLDVVVVPSVWLENAPFVIREAFAAGVPVVASDIGGMAELVEHEVNGLLFHTGDASDLARALQRLLDKPDLLPGLRHGIARPKSIEEEASELVELYDSPRQRNHTHPKVAAVVLNYRTARDTVLALRSIESSVRPIDSLYVVDNGSGDQSAVLLRRNLRSGVLIESEINLGFSGGCNLGIERALQDGSDLVLLLNSDAMMSADCLLRLEDALSLHPSAGIAGPLVLAATDPRRVASRGTNFSSRTGRMTHRGFGESFELGNRYQTETVSAVDGCVMLIRRQVFETIGNLDEDYFFSFEDLDFCLKARRAGFETLCAADAIAYHQGSRAIGADSPERLYFATRNHLLLGSRAAPLPQPLSTLRGLSILALNLAYAIKGAGVPRGQAVNAVWRGAADHLRRRYGPAPGGL